MLEPPFDLGDTLQSSQFGKHLIDISSIWIILFGQQVWFVWNAKLFAVDYTENALHFPQPARLTGNQWNNKVNVPIKDLVKMPAPKVEESLSKKERKLVAEIRMLKSRLAGFARNELECEETREKIENLAKFPSENPYPVLRISLDGTILYANEASTGLLIDKHSGLDQPAPLEWWEVAKRVLSTGAIERMEVKHAGHTIEFRVVPVMDANYCNLYGVDITEQKQAEEKLRESENIFSLFMEHSPIYVFFKDENIRSIRLSRNYEQMLGRSIDELLGKTMDEIFPSDLAENIIADDLRILNNGEPITVKEEFNGRFYETTKFPILINGKPKYLAGFTQDITHRKHAEEAVKKSEKNLEEAQSLAHLGHWNLAMTTLDVTGSEELFRIFELTCSEASLDAFVGVVHPDDREYDLSYVRRGMETGESWDIEHRLLMKDGRVKWVHAMGEAITDEEGNIFQLVGTVQDITERKQAEHQILVNRAQLKSLASELVLVEERERKRIAVHLHDDVCQNLAYSKMKLQVVDEVLDDQTQLADIADVSDILTKVMQDIQSLTFELSPPILTEFGFEAAVSHWLTEQIEQKHGIAGVFTDDGQDKPLEDDIQTLLFRSVCELLTNIVKHSQAKRVEVALSRAENHIFVRLEDDGIGFAPDKVVVGNATGGFGLFSIRERLSQMGGSLEIDSRPGQGCRSLLRAPLKQS